MLNKTITYTDYNGVERTETYHFNLSKAELTEMELTTAGGFMNMINGIINAKDTPALFKVFKDVVLKSYGVKSVDGKRFEKSEQLSKEFSETEAYSVLIVELATDDVAAVNFVNGILPADMKNKHDEQAPSALTE